ncbi:conserved hypothetical protein [Roseobacter sp. GAI101]|nr:conserved hypothetical protein [Roseobacter sp. GAI101]
MEIILHVGAHRTATTSFQHYLREHGATISATGTGLWGPLRTRNGLFSGLFPGPVATVKRPSLDRVRGRIALQLEKSRARGVKKLLITDENMIGTSRHCVRTGLLFPSVGERMARYNAAFGGGINQIVLTIRSPESWWESAAAYSVQRGACVPTQAKLDKLATMARTWRDVIIDLACAVPHAEIKVTTYEEFAGRPKAFLAQATGIDAPKDSQTRWLNRSPDLPALRAILAERGDDPDLLPDGTGRWHPFTGAQSAMMRETYADDLFWLTAGADGLATLTEDTPRTRAGKSQPAGDMKEGQHHDSQHRKLAQSG